MNEKKLTNVCFYIFSFSILIFSLFSLGSCSSRPEVKLNDGVVEDSLKKITGVTTKDLEAALEKDSLSLDDLFVLAVERTERIALKDEATNQAMAGKDKAFAGFLPTLSYVYNKFYSIPGHTTEPSLVENYRTYQSVQNGDYLSLVPSSTTSSLPPTVGAGSRLLLSFPLTGGLTAYQDYKANKSLTDQRRMEAKFEAGRMYLELAQGYFNVLQLEESLKYATEALELNTESVKERRRLYSLGRIMRSELLNAETGLANAQAILEDTRFQLEQVQTTLAMMVGFDTKIKLANIANPLEKIQIGKVDEYLPKRYDVISTQKGIEVAKANENKAWFGFSPNIAVNTYYSFPMEGQTRNKDVTAQLAVTMPLTPLGQMADLKNAESATKQAKLNASQTRRAALQEIQNATQSLENSERMCIIYEKAYQYAKDTLASQESGYRMGRTSWVDVISTRLATLNSEITFKKTNYQRLLNRVALGVAIGEIPRIPEEKSEFKIEPN
ncbi:channel protein TolC [Leptospira kobayashii]|uniref:Channel protein TolC n=1 Tax=Leptospira kobayashii TaxID=1917830 RepID=A0ABM7UQF8_9LEPT|nr:TolC family protein [Leptospira kobayashii]BDA77367.1 channel protein TolC [Leptospira kobayashii]